MAADDNKRTDTPPYVAYKTLKSFFRSLSQAVPSRIDKSIMPSMAGGTQSQIISALKALNLIDTHGAPKERLTLLVKSEGAEYQKVLREVMTASYPFLATNALDLATATMKQLEDQFGTLASGETVRKCLTFFIPAAKDAGFQLSPFIKEPGKRSSTNGKQKKTKQPNQKKPSTGESDIPPPPPSPPPLSWHELLLSKFPSFDPTWPDDVKEKWFISFNELMRKGQGGP